MALSKANNMGYQIISGYIGRYVYCTQYQAMECVDMVFVRVLCVFCVNCSFTIILSGSLVVGRLTNIQRR